MYISARRFRVRRIGEEGRADREWEERDSDCFDSAQEEETAWNWKGGSFDQQEVREIIVFFEIFLYDFRSTNITQFYSCYKRILKNITLEILQICLEFSECAIRIDGFGRSAAFDLSLARRCHLQTARRAQGDQLSGIHWIGGSIVEFTKKWTYHYIVLKQI